MNEIWYDEQGQHIEEEYVPEVLAPFLADIGRTQEEMSSRSTETVMNYRRSKDPAKLTPFERASLTGEPWIAPLNKRQRGKLKAQEAADERR